MDLKKKLHLGLIKSNIQKTEYTITRCIICNEIIKTLSKIKYFNYLDCIDHLKCKHKYKKSYEQNHK